MSSSAERRHFIWAPSWSFTKFGQTSAAETVWFILGETRCYAWFDRRQNTICFVHPTIHPEVSQRLEHIMVLPSLLLREREKSQVFTGSKTSEPSFTIGMKQLSAAQFRHLPDCHFNSGLQTFHLEIPHTSPGQGTLRDIYNHTLNGSFDWLVNSFRRTHFLTGIVSEL